MVTIIRGYSFPELREAPAVLERTDEATDGTIDWAADRAGEGDLRGVWMARRNPAGRLFGQPSE